MPRGEDRKTPWSPVHQLSIHCSSIYLAPVHLKEQHWVAEQIGDPPLCLSAKGQRRVVVSIYQTLEPSLCLSTRGQRASHAPMTKRSMGLRRHSTGITTLRRSMPFRYTRRLSATTVTAPLAANGEGWGRNSEASTAANHIFWICKKTKKQLKTIKKEASTAANHAFWICKKCQKTINKR
jgi:hypothetical protein